MKSMYLSRTQNIPVYFAYKKASNALYHQGDSAGSFSQRLEQTTGCRVVKREFDNRGYLLGLVVEFASDAAYTLFMLKWA